MTREEAIKRIKAWNLDSDDMEVLATIIPELAESEDEKIRGCIGLILTDATEQRFTDFGVSLKDCLAYLDRQKEYPTDAKLERVIKAARRVLNNWLDGTDCPDVSGDFGELEYAIREYDGEEKQKESKPEVKDLFDDEEFYRGYEAAMREQMPDIDLLKRPWYLRGYYDGKCSMEPIWVVKAEKGGPRFYENPNYGKPLSDYKVGDKIMWDGKECTIDACYPQPKQGWSEEDERMLRTIISDGSRGVELDSKQIAWLKSLRPQPHWKPSEEQMCNLKKTYESYDFCDGERDALESLYNDLQNYFSHEKRTI